jgi:superfamily II DNA/RNA helicase
MSLVGIRDMSLLQTPPADRQPILTFVGEDDERVSTEAIRRELLRDGQVFWVHNRVQSIEQRAQELRELVPEARIAVAHGQMEEGRLEQIVIDFWEGKFDVLVCTTIIEAWANGPVVRALYDCHRGKFSVCSGFFPGSPDALTISEQSTVDMVLGFYGDKDPQWLSDLTHLEQPWRVAREGIPDGERGSRIIGKDALAEYYGSL